MRSAVGQFLRHNWFLKLFSLLLASLLWLTIASETNSVINRTVPLEFQGIPNNMEITGESDTQVNLQLRGSSNLLNEMSPADVTAVISLGGHGPGSKNLPLTVANVQTPFGVEVLRIDPPRVELTLERTLTRTIPVSATIEGEPAEGFIVASRVVLPPTVTIVGPESRVGSLVSLPTATVRIDGARNDLARSVELNVVDPLVRLASLSQHEVFVQISEVDAQDTFRIALDPSLEASGWVAEPSQVVAHILGPQSLVTDLDASILSFTIATADLAPGRQVSPEVLGLDDSMTILAIVPELVEVRRVEP